MRKLKEYTKQFVVYAAIGSLVQTPIQVRAQETSAASEIMGVATKFTQMFGGFQQAKYQIMMQEIQSKKNQQLMQSLSPNCRNPNGSYCHVSQSQLFPQCALPPSMATIPQNVCNDPAGTPQSIASMLTYETIANNWINNYDQMMNTAANTSYPVGLKCIQDKGTQLSDEFTAMINNLTRLQDQLNKEKEAFKQESQKMTDQISQLHDELTGGSGKKKSSIDAQTADASKMFSAACQAVLGPKLNTDFKAGGLVRLQDGISNTSKEASNHNSNRNAIETEVRNDIQKFVNEIQNGGLSDYLDSIKNNTLSASKFTSINHALAKQSQEFTIARDRIAKELKKLNYDIPTMDKNFSVDFNDFVSSSKDFFKKQYINDCVTGADKSGVAISTDQILKSLQQKSTNSQGTATTKYRDALRNILDSDDFIQDKVNKIKSLEGQYKDITITYQNSNAQRITQTPYDLYIKTINLCEQKYATSNVENSGSSSDVSQKKKVERGQALLRELQQLHNTYASNLNQKALDQVLNCNGETKKAGASCSGASFNYTEPSFCLSHANQCANEVLGCSAEVEKHIKVRKDKMEVLAKNFNEKSKAMIARANLLYSNQRNAITALTESIQKQFPGTSFEIPTDMFIQTPDTKMDSYGVALLNDGKLNFIDELPNKINLLKEMFATQQSNVAKKVNEYMKIQTDAMNMQKNRWGNLMNECKSAVADAQNSIREQNMAAQQAQQEQDIAVGSFCNKYADMRDNPLAACGIASKLAEEVDKVQSRITSGALSYTRQFRNVCYQFNNEAEDKVATEVEKCQDIIANPEDEKKSKIASCERLLQKNAERGLASSNKYGNFGIKDVCSNNAVTNQELVKRLVDKFYDFDSDDEESLVKKIENSKSLAELSKNVSESEDPRIADFLADSGLSDSPNFCKDFSEKFRRNASPTTSSSPSVADAQKAVDEAQKAYNDSASQGPPVPELEEKLTSARKALDEAKSRNIASSGRKLNDLLGILNEPSISKDEKKAEVLASLGEQADQSCDAQASNVMMPKMFGNSLNSFDNSILGIQR